MTDTEKELMECCMELREACAACFRVIAPIPGLATKLDAEFQRIGVRIEFGGRAQDAIARAQKKENSYAEKTAQAEGS